MGIQTTLRMARLTNRQLRILKRIMVTEQRIRYIHARPLSVDAMQRLESLRAYRMRLNVIEAKIRDVIAVEEVMAGY